ncbi:YybH family protein [Chitinophaga qingshengii]|uniref:Nuclear transport factor 2 domain-containing protein n=1 Tax=Chitinophaga qingshengii TaxID=1569794 RepID=A0ABR7TQR7_9BACT|nr:ketosteroid isomerase family protein [Chitinophaga qingshengii]MBC9932807.1 hypothetical protein [Chitinophaga qingshengii]
MKKHFILAALVFITAEANTQSVNDPLAGVRKTIEASNAIFSELANKNDGSILTRYTEDACLLPPNTAPVCGRDNILKFFSSGPKVNSKFTIQHLYGDGKTFVTEESSYELTDMDGHKLDEGKVIVIWKHTDKGWKMYRDMFSSNHPAH